LSNPLHLYRYAGLRVASELLLPELSRDSDLRATGGLTIRLSPVPVIPTGITPTWQHDWLDSDDGASLSGLRIDQRYGLVFPGVAQAWFGLDGDIALWRDPDASSESLRHVLLDQVIPRLIAQRGILVLHGSMATTGGGHTVMVLGDSGMGKSTLAGGIALGGGTVLTDDCLTVSFGARPDQVHAVPSYPGLRLWPDSLAALFDERRVEATPMTHYTDKLRLPPAAPATTGAPAMIDAILVLQDPDGSDAVTLAPIAPRPACMAIIGNAFQLDLGNHRHTHQLLGLAADLAGRVPVLALTYPRDYAALPRVVERIRMALAAP